MAKILGFAPTMLKNLISKPVTKNYPAEPAVYPERSRGHVEIDIEKCVLCGLCQRYCPAGCITVDRKGSKWSINRFDCIQCGYCTEVCGKVAINIVPGYQKPAREKTVCVVDKPVVEKKYPKPDLDTCVYCTLCAKKCPAEALEVDRKEKIWKLKKGKCVSCGLCAKNCPKKCITMEVQK